MKAILRQAKKDTVAHIGNRIFQKKYHSGNIWKSFDSPNLGKKKMDLRKTCNHCGFIKRSLEIEIKAHGFVKWREHKRGHDLHQ